MCAQSCLTLCDPMGWSPPAASVNGIFQARILEWFAIPPPGYLPDPGIEPASPSLAGGFFTTEPFGTSESVKKLNKAGKWIVP